MIKAICMDMDGTLLTSDKRILEETKEKLIELAKQDIKLILASGRVRKRMEEYAQEIKLIEHGGIIIEANGASIYDYKKEESKVIGRMQRKEADELIAFFKMRDVEILVMGEVNVYIMLAEDEKKSRYLVNNENMEGLKNRTFHYIKSIDEIKEDLNKIAIYEREERIQELVKEFKEETFNYAYWHGCSSLDWLEITPASISKGMALQMVMDEYDYKIDEVVVFGDGENDLSMLQCVKYGVAMENAMKSVKDRVNYITKSNDENGILALLNELI